MDDYNLNDICRQINEWVVGADFSVAWHGSEGCVTLCNGDNEITEGFDFDILKRLKQIAKEEGLFLE